MSTHSAHYQTSVWLENTLALLGIVCITLWWPFTTLWKGYHRYRDILPIRKAAQSIALLAVGLYACMIALVVTRSWPLLALAVMAYLAISIWRAVLQLFFADDPQDAYYDEWHGRT